MQFAPRMPLFGQITPRRPARLRAQLNTTLAYIEHGNLGVVCDNLNALIGEGDGQEKASAWELLAQIA